MNGRMKGIESKDRMKGKDGRKASDRGERRQKKKVMEGIEEGRNREGK